VIELSSQGFSQSDIAFALKVDRSIISRDMAYLKRQSKENLQHLIDEIIPTEWEKAMTSLNQVLRLTWAIVGKTPDEKTRLQALSLIAEVNKYRIDLATDGTIVSDALKSIQSKIDRISKNGNGKGNDGYGDKTTVDNNQTETDTEESEDKDQTSNTVF
jgi:hypothetical protein